MGKKPSDKSMLQAEAERSISENPSVFPSLSNLSSLLAGRGMKCSPSHLSNALDFRALQLAWASRCSDDDLLSVMAQRGRTNKADSDFMRAASARLASIVPRRLAANPAVFPSEAELCRLLGGHSRVRTFATAVDIVSVQAAWVTSSSEGDFLNAMRDGKFNGAPKETKALVSARASGIIRRELGKEPSVFPVTGEIIALLEKAGISMSESTVQKYAGLPQLQADWIERAGTRGFIAKLSEPNGFPHKGYIETHISKKLNAVIRAESSAHPECFPSMNRVQGLLAGYGLKSMSPIRKYADLSALQMEWIAGCDDAHFLENVSRSVFARHKAKYRDLILARMNFIISCALASTPDIFPSPNHAKRQLDVLCGADSAKSTVNSSSIRDGFDFTAAQIEWVRTCSPGALLANAQSHAMKGYADAVGDEISLRFAALVTEVVAEMPEAFPVPKKIAAALGSKHGVRPSESTIVCRIDVAAIHAEWLSRCEMRVLFDNLSMNAMKKLEKRCKAIVLKRISAAVRDVLKENPEVYPVKSRIAELIGRKHGSNCLSAWKYVNLTRLQADWVKKSKEADFLNAHFSHSFTSAKPKVRAAVHERMHDVIVSHPEDFSSLGLDRQTLERLLKVYPDLSGIIRFDSHNRTIDQRLVAMMGPLRNGRSPELHSLVGERLEQLWGFRELLALAKDGRCLDAHVISPFHEAIPDRLREYVPRASVTHLFPDEVFDGNFSAGPSKDVLLLSFMGWLTPRQAAGFLMRLNPAVGADNPIALTFPARLSLCHDIQATLGAFGFEALRIGALYLFPPEDEVECKETRKAHTASSLMVLGKSGHVRSPPPQACIFQGAKGGPGEASESEENVISYGRDVLEASQSLVTLRDVSSIIVDLSPEVRKIILDPEAAILQLAGGAVVGFNMDPKTPFTVEIEGRAVPKGAEQAVLSAIYGTGGIRFEVPGALSQKYQEFLETIRRKRDSIKGVSVRAVSAKRSGRKGI